MGVSVYLYVGGWLACVADCDDRKHDGSLGLRNSHRLLRVSCWAVSMHGSAIGSGVACNLQEGRLGTQALVAPIFIPLLGVGHATTQKCQFLPRLLLQARLAVCSRTMVRCMMPQSGAI